MVEKKSRIYDLLIIGVLVFIVMGSLIAFYDEVGLVRFVAFDVLKEITTLFYGILIVSTIIIFIERLDKEEEPAKNN